MPLCLVTGATGLIGSHLVPALLKEGWQVFCLGRNASEGQNIHLIEADLENPWDSAKFPARIDAVIHLAQSEHYRSLLGHADKVFQVNTASTWRLLEYAKKAGATRFILASSGAVYGYGDIAFQETDLCSSHLDFYGASRHGAELLARMSAADMTIILLRFFFVYGPGQKETMLVPRLIQSVKSKTPVMLQGKNGLRLNPVYVEDAVQALMAALKHGQSDVFNIAGPEILTLREIAKTIGEAVGKTPVFQVNEGETPRSLIGNIRKMSDRLSAPRVNFSQGIERMVEPARILA